MKHTSFKTLQQENAKYIKNKPLVYKGGDGFSAHVLEKFKDLL